MKADLIVKNGTIVTGEGQFPGVGVAIVDGKFAVIAQDGELPEGREVFDAGGQHILPGVIDGHVHFREPGLEYKEDFGTGSRAAVMGGVTTVLDMPNTKPPTQNVEVVRLKQRLAEEKSYVDFGILGLVVQENVDDLAPMASAGVVGYKCFLGETIGSIPAPDDGALLDAMRVIGSQGLRVGFHAENNGILQHLIRKLKADGRTDALAHVESRPPIAEVEAIQRVALFAKYTGTKIHIFHLSSRDGLTMIEEWRRHGVDITCETGAHYCFLSTDDMKRLGSILRMNPPVRDRTHGEALLRGLACGSVTQIATDHSPHTREEKLNDDIWKAISGFAGVEVSVPLFLTEAVNPGKLSLEQFVAATSMNPAKTWGIYPQKGSIQVGSDADLTIVDLEREGVIDAGKLHGKNNVTPFDGWKVRGMPTATIIRGHVVVREGEFQSGPLGRMVRPATATREHARKPVAV